MALFLERWVEPRLGQAVKALRMKMQLEVRRTVMVGHPVGPNEELSGLMLPWATVLVFLQLALML